MLELQICGERSVCLGETRLFGKHAAAHPSCPASELLFALAISLTLAAELPFVVKFTSTENWQENDGKQGRVGRECVFS